MKVLVDADDLRKVLDRIEGDAPSDYPRSAVAGRLRALVGRAPAVCSEAVAAGGNVMLEATSMFGNEYDGPVSEAPL